MRLCRLRSICAVAEDFRFAFSSFTLPARALRVLKRLHLGLDAVAAMDYSFDVEGMTSRDAARRWIKRNPGLIEAWLQQD